MNAAEQALDRVLTEFRERGRVTRSGSSWMVQCPAHDDSTASLSIALGSQQPVTMVCLAGCDTADVLAAIGLTYADICAPAEERPQRGEWTPHGEAVAVYDYTDEQGAPLFQVLRTAGKQFPQRRRDPSARSGWRWKLDGVRRVPYHLPQLIAGVEAGSTIWVPEGEKDVHALEAAGAVATTNPGGAGKWRADYDRYLAGADVTIVADKDEPGRKHAVNVAEGLRRVGARVRIVEALTGKDAADHLAAGHGLDRFTVTQSEPEARGEAAGQHQEPAAQPSASGGGRASSAATVLVDIAAEMYQFATSDTGDAYGVPRSGPRLVYLLRGGRRSLRAQLAREFWHRSGKVASDSALADAMLVVHGLAQDADPVPLHVRVAQADGAIWVDLGDDTGRAVRADASGWTVEAAAPVLFRRTALTGVMPEPVRGGGIGELWRFLNVTEDDRPLVAGHLVGTFQPGIMHPALGIFGEHGTAKSSASRILVELTDPSPVPIRKPPKDTEAWVTAASGSWVVALDNLSAIPDWLSDSLCRAVTGEGDVRRKLYTDGDLAVFAFLRVLILNGIDIGPMRGDLIDRMMPIHLDVIPDDKRLEEADLWREFSAARPRLLGAVLDLTVQALRRAPSVELPHKPRMASFARVLASVDGILGSDGVARYEGKQRGMVADMLSADPFVTRIRAALGGPFEGCSADLLAEVTPSAEGWRPPRGWPATPRSVTGLLRREAPGMRKTGWEVDELPAGHGNVVRWAITPPRDGSDGDSQDSQDSQHAADQRIHGPRAASQGRDARESASYRREARADNSHASDADSRPPDGVYAGQEAGARDASLASHDSPQLPGTDSASSHPPADGAHLHTRESGALSLLQARLGAVPVCPDCGEAEDSPFHAAQCLGQEEAR